MKIGTSFAVPKVSDLRELVPTAEPVAIVVGAFAHGSVSACVPYLTVKIFIGIDFSLVLSMGFFFCCSFFGLVLLIPPPPPPFPSPGKPVKKGPMLQCLGLFSLPREGTSEG